MTKYISNRVKDLKVGISDYSENLTSLEVVGTTVLAGLTTITADGINISGVITATSFSGSPGSGSGIIGEDIITRNLNVTGISTLGVTSVTSSSAFHSKQLNISGISTFNNNIYIGNVKIDSSGIVTAASGVVTYYGDGSVLTGIANTDNIVADTLTVTGVTTFGNINPIQISSGIISAVDVPGYSGIVTYYGDGQHLQNIDANTIGDLSKLNVIGISTLDGEVNLKDDVNVGTTTSHTVTVTGRFDSDLIPYDQGTRDLGSESNKWRNIYVKNINLPGGGTAGENIVTQNLKVSGVSTFNDYVGLETGLTVAGFSTLTYGAKIGKLDVDNTGIVTAVSGIITYYGDGSKLVGVDTTAIKDVSKVIRVEANSSGAFVTGVLTATEYKGGGIDTAGTSSFTNLNLSGDLDVDGYTDLDDLNVTGISTFTNRFSTTGVTTLGKGVSGSVEIYDTDKLKFRTTGLGISIASGTAKTAHIEGPEEIWIDPAAVGDNTGIVRIKGDLYVDGTNFVVDSETITLGDHKVGIASTVSDNTLLDGGGIGIGSANIEKTLTWNNASTSLKSSENFDLADTKTYKINGTDVLSADTLGSGVTISSLTSLGTIAYLQVTDANVTGISTLGVTSTTNLETQQLNVTGISSVGLGITMYGDTGIVSATKFYGSGEFLTDISADTIGDLSHLVVSGISTLGNVKFETAGIVTAVSGIVTYYGDGGHLTGVATALNGNAVATNLKVSGVSTFVGIVTTNSDLYVDGHTELDDLNVTGVSTFNDIIEVGIVKIETAGIVTSVSGVVTYYGDGGHLTGIATALNGNAVATNLKVSGVSTFSGLVEAGIVSATTFKGEGSQLTNVLKIEDEGSSVGSSATTINFVGPGVSAIYSNGISTVTIETTAADSSKWVTTAAGIHTLSNVGVGTTNPQTSLQVGDVYGVASGIGTWISAAGVAHTINEYTIATNDFKTAEYTIHIGIGTKIQSQKVLIMQNGTTAYTQEYAVMYSNDLLVSIGSTIETGVMKLQVTPDTGISGLGTYRFSRHTLL